MIPTLNDPVEVPSIFKTLGEKEKMVVTRSLSPVQDVFQPITNTIIRTTTIIISYFVVSNILQQNTSFNDPVAEDFQKSVKKKKFIPFPNFLLPNYSSLPYKRENLVPHFILKLFCKSFLFYQAEHFVVWVSSHPFTTHTY